LLNYEVTTWALLLLAPPGAAVLVHIMRRWIPPTLPWVLGVAGVIVVIGAGGAIAGVRFMSGSANVVALWIIYSAYCVLAFALGLIKRPLLRWPLQLMSFAPIAYGYFFGTVGALALLFLIGDAVEQPVETQRFRGGLICEIINQDEGPGSNGHILYVYKSWSPLPLRQRLGRRRIEVGGVLTGACRDAVESFGQARRSS
jgi:hypothetical protein